MLISVIVPTANRQAFMPWLWWNFKKQTYPDRELVIVDGSAKGAAVHLDADPRIRVIRAIPGTSIGAMRNIAIAAARGDAIAPWDDDDWQHPDKLAWLTTALARASKPIVGWNHGHFVMLEGFTVHDYKGPAGWCLPIGCAVRASLARAVPFPNRSSGEDTVWMQAILQRTRAAMLSDDVTHSFWLRHGYNTSTPQFLRSRSWYPLADLLERIGPGWGSTSEELLALKERVLAFELESS